MRFFEHNFIKEGSKVSCTICQQNWSGYPRTDCPGVPVVDYDHKDEKLLTLHQLEKAHLHPVDRELPDATYRIIHQPYFQPLYDRTKAIPWTPEEMEAERLALAERERKRAESIYKYTCQICGEYKQYPYGAGMRNRVCSTCQQHIMEWNLQIERVQKVVRPATLLVDFHWNKESGWPFEIELYGYTVLALESGELLRHTNDVTPEDQEYMLALLKREKGKLIFLDYPMARLIEGPWHTWYIANKRLHLRMHDLIKYAPLGGRRYEYVREHEPSDLCTRFGVIVPEDANDAERLRALLLHINLLDRTLLPEVVEQQS